MAFSGSACLAFLRVCAFSSAGQGGGDCHQAAEASDQTGAFLVSETLSPACKMLYARCAGADDPSSPPDCVTPLSEGLNKSCSGMSQSEGHVAGGAPGLQTY